ncbi:hypothetical protein GCM10023091_16010 [Ravibacter arvi]|uniref:HTH araC/xylS-type domain-containing protein n=1 Tax=Ravibacter arvi TaxID=2051041 RepID=A0ABP8LW74_9BACT
MTQERLKDGGIGRRITPPASEEAVFTHFYYARNDSDSPVTRHFIPSFEIFMVFSFGTPVTLAIPDREPMTGDRCLLIGPVRRAFAYTMHPGSEILSANFKHDAYYRFFGEINPGGNPVNPDESFEGTPFRNLSDSLSGLPGVDEKVAGILAFARPYLAPRAASGERIVALSELEAHLNPIKVISGEEQISERAVQLRHKKYLGYTAKEITRYKRFLQTLKFLEGKKLPVDWAETVALNGYYDQSQMIRDFKFYLNLTPTGYLASRESLCSSNVD